jgi:hypothetical protein
MAPPQAAEETVTADRWLRHFRAILVGVLGVAVGGIGALAFYTSFEAIKSYANGSGGIDPKHDFAIPLLVDSFIVVATGADLWFSTTKQQRRLWEIWWPKALLTIAAAVSFVLNIAHAEHGDWAARGVAAIPPAALILGVELLMMVLRRATTLRAEQLETTAPATPSVPAVPAIAESRLQPAIAAVPAVKRRRGRAAGEWGRRTDAARTYLREQRATGRPRPTTAALVNELVSNCQLARSSRLRALVKDEWPEEATQDSKEPAA